MSFRATALRRSHLIVFLLALIAPPAAFGQLKNEKGELISPIAFTNQDAITVSFVPTPNYGGTATGGGGEPGQWLKVEFHYGTTSVVTPALPFVDAVEFKVWIEGFDQYALNPARAGGKGVSVALTGSVTYVNVPIGKDLYGVFYVHPSTLARYASERGTEDFERKFDVHLEAYVGGTLMDAIDKNKETDPKWFQLLRATPNLVYRQDQCPFLMADVDRYPAIKVTPSP